jgi:hypothetical protein
MTHPLATDYCDRNYNGSTLPIFTSKTEEDEFNPAWIRYTKQNTVGEIANNWYWLAYQLEPGGEGVLCTIIMLLLLVVLLCTRTMLLLLVVLLCTACICHLSERSVCIRACITDVAPALLM